MLNKLIKQVADAWNAAPDSLQIVSISAAIIAGVVTGAAALALLLVTLCKAMGVLGIVVGFTAVALLVGGITLLVGYLRQKR